MELSELNDLYQKDAKIDLLNLEKEASEAGNLHARYIRLWTEERTKYSSLLKVMRKLRFAKEEFYNKGPSKETHKLGWKYPVSGMILKTKVQDYVNNDEHVLKQQQEIDEQQIKVDALEKIVQTLSFRSNNINLILSIRKWEGGG